jgi:hypothetical protein
VVIVPSLGCGQGKAELLIFITHQSDSATNFLSVCMGGYGSVLGGAMLMVMVEEQERMIMHRASALQTRGVTRQRNEYVNV